MARREPRSPNTLSLALWRRFVRDPIGFGQYCLTLADPAGLLGFYAWNSIMVALVGALSALLAPNLPILAVENAFIAIVLTLLGALVLVPVSAAMVTATAVLLGVPGVSRYHFERVMIIFMAMSPWILLGGFMTAVIRDPLWPGLATVAAMASFAWPALPAALRTDARRALMTLMPWIALGVIIVSWVQ